MKNNILKKKVVLFLSLVCVLGSVSVVNAKSVKTDEFGTFSYSLTKSENKIYAQTSCSKTASKLITSLVVEKNSTGEKLFNVKNTKDNCKKNDVIYLINNSNNKLAVFSAHEAKGKTSIVRYEAEVF